MLSLLPELIYTVSVIRRTNALTNALICSLLLHQASLELFYLAAISLVR